MKTGESIADQTRRHRALADPQRAWIVGELGRRATGAAAESADGAERAEAAGRAWGRFLVERPAPHVRVTDDQAVDAVVAVEALEPFVEPNLCVARLDLDTTRR